jgi:hypothetical protein
VILKVFGIRKGKKGEIHTGIQLISNQGLLAEKFSITALHLQVPRFIINKTKGHLN